MKIHTWQRSCQKTSKTSLKTLSEKRTAETRRKIVPSSFFFFFFLNAPQRGDISRSCCYLYIHSLLFQSMTNRWRSLAKGGVDLVVLSLSTSPHPTPPSYAPSPHPRLLDSSVPPEPQPALDSSHVGRLQKPACRYCSSFQISIMSLVADVHMCCPCVYPERRTLFCFGFFFVSFFCFLL